MKKLLFTLLALYGFSTCSFGQTLLATHPLELKKATSSHQILNAVNNQNQVFAFASDKESLRALKFNNALFFKDSLSAVRPDKSYEFMAGYSFEDNGNPYLYWASADYFKIQSVYFDFENKTTTTTEFRFPYKEEEILSVFSENNSFYVLTQFKKEDKLKFYSFNKGKVEEKIIDFSSYKFLDEDGKTSTFNKLISENSIEKIDTKSLNPLFQSASKIKFYILSNRMILTFDSLSRTQLFDINLDTFNMTEKTIPSATLVTGVGESNSYFHQDKLYQIKTNDEQLVIAAVDIASGETLKSYSVGQKDTISFKNSPLYSQTGNERGQEIKNTKKFLQKLRNCHVGISVYKTPNAIMVTAGGIRNISSSGGLILGISAGIAMISAGGYYPVDYLFDAQNLQSIYFEGLFDEKFEHKNMQQQGLAVDYISQFQHENNISLVSVFPYNDYFIMGYYDSKKKEYALRKFEDFHD